MANVECLFGIFWPQLQITDPQIVTVVGQVFGERVCVDDVRGFNAVQDDVHDPDDKGQPFAGIGTAKGGD